MSRSVLSALSVLVLCSCATSSGVPPAAARSSSGGVAEAVPRTTGRVVLSTLPGWSAVPRPGEEDASSAAFLHRGSGAIIEAMVVDSGGRTPGSVVRDAAQGFASGSAATCVIAPTEGGVLCQRGL